MVMNINKKEELRQRDRELRKFTRDVNNNTYDPPPISINGVTLSRNEIGRRTGISMAMISRIFAGTRSPSFYYAKLIAWSFGWKDEEMTVPVVTLDQLYDFLLGRKELAVGRVDCRNELTKVVGDANKK